MCPFAMPASPSSRVWVFYAALLSVFLAGWAADPLCAQEDAANDGLFITVPNPITDQAVEAIRKKIDRALITKQRKIATVVFDFNAKDQPNTTSNFGSCSDLADFIVGLNLNKNPTYPRINTVAFVHNEVAKHTVLPVLACNMIVLSNETDPNTRQSKARLGDVDREQKGLSRSTATAYREIANSRKNFSPDLVQRMVHRDLVLKCVSYLDKGNPIKKYISQDNYEKLVGEVGGAEKIKELDIPPGLQPGNAMFDAELGETVGLCSIKNSRIELAEALNLPRKSLTEDWLEDESVIVPWRIELRGPLDRGKLDSLRRRVDAARGKKANFIILQLEGDGGDTTHVASAAEYLRTLKDDNGVPIMTVAYIPPGQSLGAATFLALGCNEIVMGPKAVLADFSYLKEEDMPTVSRMLTPLAKEQGYPALLFEACLNKNLALHRVRSAAAVGGVQLISEEQFLRDEKTKPPRWVSDGRLAAGSLRNIPADLARQFQIAQWVDLQDISQVYAKYGLETQRVNVSRDDWLDQVAEFFRQPWVNFLLIMFGIIGLILELKMPGTTVPGVIAAICFVLFFWAYSFVGEFTLLAILLFILGLILIGVEIFIIPGFGFPGIAGLVLVISSLVLVTLDRMPQSSQDWVNLGATIGTFGLSLLAAMIGAFLLAWYLPSIPYANRLVLQPPPEENEMLDTASRVPVNAALLGAIGVAATPLRPSGKAQFGDDFLDVIAEGDYVKPGSRVQIIELEGNRIVVKEIG